MIFPENFEHKIDFVKVRELLKEHCLSEIGQSLVGDMKFMNRFDSIKARLNETNEFKSILKSQQEFPVEHYFDLRPAIHKIRLTGSFLEVKELFQLRKSMQTVKLIILFFKKEDAEAKYPTLKGISKNVVVHPYVTDGIDRILNSHGKIKDKASPELAKIRSDLAAKQSSVSKLIHRIIHQAQKDGWVDADVSLVIRDGRSVIPVPASFKRKIPGIVHDESATGKTCYVEPTPVVEINNELNELEAEERREIVKILKEFTDTIRPYADDLEDGIVFLGIMDFIRAKAKFALRINASLPMLKNEPEVNWQNAIHPLLFLTFQEEERQVVPLTLKLDVEKRILLISGPNAGGKSVCLKTVGLLQYMLQCGMLIPVEKKSEAGIFSNLFIDIGDEQSIENDLSTYSSHLLNMKHFTKNANEKTLVLIDEFGTGTEPMLGGAIAESVLNKLNNDKAFGVITTHYTNLKHFASSQEGIVNGAMLYDSQKLEPLFKLEIGKPGSSFAFEIAYKIGLPQDIIDDAKSKVGEDHVNFDKHLKEILRDKAYWERKRQNIRKVERRLEEMMEKEKVELEQAKEIRKEIKEKAQIEAHKLLADSNKLIENTVRKIKESQADKEKTKEVRKEVDVFKDKISKVDSAEEERINRKMQKIRERENRVIKKDDKKDDSALVEKPKKLVREKEFTIGMPVKIIGQKSIGEIMELSHKNAVVAFGNLLTTIDIKKLEHLDNNEKKQVLRASSRTGAYTQSYDLNQRRIRFKPGLDVRGKRAEEAIQMVTEFIDEAIMLNVSEVKILHGTGSGILRQLIREYLSTVDVVARFKDEKIEFGGAGITVVQIG
ncbi:MAG: Smr/MutS family protein [Salinivirgaceae bacterium]|nr:Smr/MutS family protein [Salinivirgaceae bacterium]